MKKHIIIMLIGLLCFKIVASQNILNYEWKFNTGDDLLWANPNFNDSGWVSIVAGFAWENQGFTNYNGFAWYRQTLIIPSDLKSEAIKNGGLMLYLDKIDDADYTYLNGELLATSGELPPHYQSAHNKERAYKIPTDKIKWDSENTLAIRVYDALGFGGIIGEKYGLFIKGSEELFKIEPKLPQSNHLFLEPGDVSLPINFVNQLTKSVEGNVQIIVNSDAGEMMYHKSIPIKLKANKSQLKMIVIGELAPNFYKVIIDFKSINNYKRITFNIGVQPEKIVSPINRTHDFSEYWQRAKDQLACIDPQYNWIRQDSLCTPEKEVFIIEMRSLGNVLIRGWYNRPTKPGFYPAILHLQGYSTSANYDWGYPDNDMISLVLNIRGHGFSRDFINPGFPGYLQYMVEDKELYVYRGAYMDCIRAIDFLYSQPQVDTSRIAVEGGSQGGALSMATAALDNQRIRLCVPSVPFLSDFEDYFKIAEWPVSEFQSYFKYHPDTRDIVMNTLSYIDIKNLAPWIKAPVFMTIGLADRTCPPHINFAAYNQIKSEKQYLVYPFSDHALPEVYTKIKYDYIREKFGLIRP